MSSKDIVPLMARLPADLHAEIKLLADADERSLNKMLVLLIRLGLTAWKKQRPG